MAEPQLNDSYGDTEDESIEVYAKSRRVLSPPTSHFLDP